MLFRSPTLLVEFLTATGPELSKYFASLDPHAPAPFPVAWAGELRLSTGSTPAATTRSIGIISNRFVTPSAHHRSPADSGCTR